MKVAVIGLGSMGKRRIRLIKKYNLEIEIIGIDLKDERRKEVETLYRIDTEEDLDISLKKYEIEAVFISTSPLSHARLIHICLKNNVHVFTELNLIDKDYEKNMTLAEKKNKVLFLSSTFLYRDEVQFIYEQVKKQAGKLAYQYHVGQYLPDWHPWERYQDFFIGQKATNGCREILAVDLPWLINIFGDIKNINVIRRKTTNLEIDFYDQYLLLIEHKDGHAGTLLVDVVARKAVRNFELTGEDIYLRWDGSPTGLYQYNIGKKTEENIKLYNKVDTIEGYSSFVIENAYYSEIANFFAVIEGKEMPRYSFEKDKKLLEWIDKIEGKRE